VASWGWGIYPGQESFGSSALSARTGQVSLLSGWLGASGTLPATSFGTQRTHLRRAGAKDALQAGQVAAARTVCHLASQKSPLVALRAEAESASDRACGCHRPAEGGSETRMKIENGKSRRGRQRQRPAPSVHRGGGAALDVLGPCEVRWSVPGSHGPRLLFTPTERRLATSLSEFPCHRSPRWASVNTETHPGSSPQSAFGFSSGTNIWLLTGLVVTE
jgi:hypothetical protein